MSVRQRAVDKQQSDTFTVAAVSEFLGVPIPTLRSWERRYSFPAPNRTRGGHRRYTMHEVELLGAFRDEVTAGRPPRKVAETLKNRASTQSQPEFSYVLPLLDAAQNMDGDAVTKALDDAADALGTEPAVQDVLLPGVREIGFRWQTGRCGIAHEHITTQAVRAWIALRTAGSRRRGSRGTILLACGPLDLHSIALEAFALLLTRRNWRATLLGPMTPADCLQQAITARDAKAVVISSHQSVNRRAAVQAIGAVASQRVPVFYAGNAFSAETARNGVAGTYLGDDLVAAAAKLMRGLGDLTASADQITAK